MVQCTVAALGFWLFFDSASPDQLSRAPSVATGSLANVATLWRGQSYDPSGGNPYGSYSRYDQIGAAEGSWPSQGPAGYRSPLPLPPVEPGSPLSVDGPIARMAANPHTAPNRDGDPVQRTSATAPLPSSLAPTLSSPEGDGGQLPLADGALRPSNQGATLTAPRRSEMIGRSIPRDSLRQLDGVDFTTGSEVASSHGTAVLPAAGFSASCSACSEHGGAGCRECGLCDSGCSGKSWSRFKHRYRACPDWYDLDFVVRGYYVNDQRIEWSGQEATFGAEGAFAPRLHYRFGNWETSVDGEFYLNQPFDRNRLVDTRERASYAHNFEYDTFEISQLSITCRNGNLAFCVGKFVTPFGRTHFPLYSNARFDAPFIRTEAILWRETGLLIRWDPGYLVADVALTNGSEDLDTNSSKALVSRIGLEGEQFGVGASIKVQDGIGSEDQKRYNNHFGVDAMIRRGRLTLSAEAIYDEYGFRRPGFDPNDITWGRSIYYRDLHYKLNTPITGVGYYLNLGINSDRLVTNLNYGEYYPMELGNAQHDRPNRRGLVKVDYYCTPCLQMYAVVILETEGYVAQDNRLRKGNAILTGLQYTF